jgi:hypothetical protein
MMMMIIYRTFPLIKQTTTHQLLRTYHSSESINDTLSYYKYTIFQSATSATLPPTSFSANSINPTIHMPQNLTDQIPPNAARGSPPTLPARRRGESAQCSALTELSPGDLTRVQRDTIWGKWRMRSTSLGWSSARGYCPGSGPHDGHVVQADASKVKEYWNELCSK